MSFESKYMKAYGGLPKAITSIDPELVEVLDTLVGELL